MRERIFFVEQYNKYLAGETGRYYFGKSNSFHAKDSTIKFFEEENFIGSFKKIILLHVKKMSVSFI